MNPAPKTDMAQLLRYAHGSDPVAQTAGAVNGAAADRIPGAGQQFDSGLMIVSLGAVSGAPSSFTVTNKIQESDDNSTWSDVAWADILPDGDSAPSAMDTASTEQVVRLAKLRNRERYLRVVSTAAFVSGTSPAVVHYSSLVLTGPNKLPVTVV